ncbi:dihydropteroate synthase [Odoribacter lunatus]|uniref:dihydropteroate synthase n=1 Tax=Odoribacter lunatus TaxID=2941335 RepID=UPI00203BB978|nr:dihydropteroate synthase [Odoribacter lunatus]
MMKTPQLGSRLLDISRPVVMGILNVTSDSFFDGGRYETETAIVARIHQIVEEGAGIIDIGAYSTRPGATDVDEREELTRLDAAVELVRKYFPEVPVSIDTFRAGVARDINRCLGPVIVNDISGGTMDPDMFGFIAETGLPYIMMHIQGTPQTMQKNPEYRDVVEDVYHFFEKRIQVLNAVGFDNIIIDPGFGFGKNLQHNYELMNRLEVFGKLDYPLLVGISRKSMIFRLLGTSPAEALNGTTVLNTVALLKGASILRVHDVKEAVEAVKIVAQMGDLPFQPV